MQDNKSRNQVTNALKALFKKYDIENGVTVDDIKKWIWNSVGPGMESVNKYNKKCLNLFPQIDDMSEINNLMQVFVDAWNYFPHKELNGKSPNEVYMEIYGQKGVGNPSNSKVKNEVMPKIMVGDHEMEWEEFQLMLKQIEKAQIPFKTWIEKDALPKYKKYLAQVVKVKKTCEEHYDIADLFFQRVLHVGFIELKDIRSNFIHSEFPRWWPTHVMYSNLRPAAIKKSLELLFEFIELVYNIKR